MSSKSGRLFSNVSPSILSGGDTGVLGKIKSSISSLSWTTIGIIVATIVLIVVAVVIYNQQMASNLKTTYNESNSSRGSGKEAELLLFYVDWCPHCKTAKPEWAQVKSEYEGKTINGYQIIFTEINCTNESPDVEKMMNTYKIEGYPTIKLLKDGQIIEYDAKPTKDTLVKFLNTTL
jgi:thiol-disulfide isomerase/thioredoxin